MTIPARQIVQINPRLLQAGGTDLVLNGLVLTRNSLIPSGTRAISFTDADSVGDYFGYTSDEYNFAVIYFNGYDNSFKKPRSILFGLYIDSGISAWLKSAPYKGTLEALQAITSGELTISVDGASQTATGIDLSACTSFSAVAEAIQDKLAGETVSYSSLNKCFTITSATTGATSTITYASSGLATTLGFTEELGAVISQGLDAETAAENMAAIITVSNNWVCFTTMWAATDDTVLELAAWSSGKGVDYLYLPYSTDVKLVTTGATNSIADKIIDANVGATALQYGDYKYSAFIAGTVASIDWERLNGTITLAFKKQTGISANVTDATSANLLEAKKVNFVGDYATRNDDFVWLYPAAIYGDYNFIDPYVNAVWLNNKLQVALMNGLATYGRIPYTPAGYEMIRASMLDVVKAAQKNGVIDAGLELSETQKAELIREYGSDSIITELDNYGYCIQVADAGASVRTTRDTPNISLWYTYGGAVQRIVVASTAVI